MPARAKDFEAALKKKGFLEERSTQDKLFYLYHNGQKTQIHTKVSHGRGEELRDNILGQIKRQLMLDTGGQLTEFIRCGFSHQDYIQLLVAKGQLAP